MLFAINVPQSKSVSIAFVSLKSMIFGLILTTTSQQISNRSSQQQCNQSIASFMSILQIFFVLGIIIDLFSLGYFYFSKQFKKIEYYIFFIYHVIVSFICIFGGLNNSDDYSGCDVSKSFYMAIASSAIVLQVSVLVTMVSNLFIVLKFLHFGSNIVWFFIWTTTLECSRIDTALIVIVHSILSIANVVTLILYRWFGKTLAIVKFWKTLCVSSIFLMIFCYLVVLLGLQSASTCQQDDFFIKNYVRYGLFEIISPILVMIFLRNESGDPRESKIKQHNEVFGKKDEHQFVDFSAKI